LCPNGVQNRYRPQFSKNIELDRILERSLDFSRSVIA
jgi:hypothetical protein